MVLSLFFYWRTFLISIDSSLRGLSHLQTISWRKIDCFFIVPYPLKLSLPHPVLSYIKNFVSFSFTVAIFFYDWLLPLSLISLLQPLIFSSSKRNSLFFTRVRSNNCFPIKCIIFKGGWFANKFIKSPIRKFADNFFFNLRTFRKCGTSRFAICGPTIFCDLRT